MSTINVNLWELTDTELIGALNYEIWKFGPTGNRPVSSWDERIEMHNEPVSRLYLENGCYENEPAKIIGLFEKEANKRGIKRVPIDELKEVVFPYGVLSVEIVNNNGVRYAELKGYAIFCIRTMYDGSFQKFYCMSDE